MNKYTNDTASTGYGQHADYVFGWKEDSLQRAMDKCNDGFGTPESCKELTVQPDSAINACSQKSRVAEQVDGCESLLELHALGIDNELLWQGLLHYLDAILFKQVLGEPLLMPDVASQPPICHNLVMNSSLLGGFLCMYTS